MTTRETISTYEFEEDAAGLGDWLTSVIRDLSDDEAVVYVADEEGRPALLATLERETLTDGSTVVNLVIKFDRQLG